MIGRQSDVNRQALDFIIVKYFESSDLQTIQQQLRAVRQQHKLVGDAPDDFEVYNPADVLATQAGSARVLASCSLPLLRSR